MGIVDVVIEIRIALVAGTVGIVENAPAGNYWRCVGSAKGCGAIEIKGVGEVVDGVASCVGDVDVVGGN